MAEINFFEEEIDASLPDKARLQTWLINLAKAHDFSIFQINYIFCSDTYLLNINQQHLDHDYYTDIITFPYRSGRSIEADIFISIDRVADNAKVYNSTYDQELLRVMSHGLLHLMGYNDQTQDQKAIMRQEESKAIGQFGL